MVAFNFKAEFAEAVECGQKRQTIRLVRLSGNPRKGCALQFYTGMRTKACRKLLEATCKSVEVIVIHPSGDVFIDGRKLAAVGCFARRDGFKGKDDFLAFFQKQYGLPFTGQLIRW